MKQVLYHMTATVVLDPACKKTPVGANGDGFSVHEIDPVGRTYEIDVEAYGGDEALGKVHHVCQLVVGLKPKDYAVAKLKHRQTGYYDLPKSANPKLVHRRTVKVPVQAEMF